VPGSYVKRAVIQVLLQFGILTPEVKENYQRDHANADNSESDQWLLPREKYGE